MAAKRTSAEAFAASLGPNKKQKATDDLDAGRRAPQTAISLYLESAEFTDAVLVCRGRIWPVHRLKLAECSEYFRKAFSTKQQAFQEGANNLIDFSESEEPESIERLLTWIYTPKLVPTKESYHIAGTSPELVVDELVAWQLDLMRLADYFIIPDLFEKSSAAIVLMIRNSSYNSTYMLTTATAGLPLTAFCAVGRHLLDNSHEAIRAQWVATATFNWAELQNCPAAKVFQDFLHDVPELLIEIVDLLHSTPSWQERFQKNYEKSSLFKKCAKPVIQTAKKKMNPVKGE